MLAKVTDDARIACSATPGATGSTLVLVQLLVGAMSKNATHRQSISTATS